MLPVTAGYTVSKRYWELSDMQLRTGIRRLSIVATLGCLAFIPLEAAPSLFAQTRQQFDTAAAHYRWEEATTRPDHVLPPTDAFVSRVMHSEAMLVGITFGVVLCLGMIGWVAAGFHSDRA